MQAFRERERAMARKLHRGAGSAASRQRPLRRRHPHAPYWSTPGLTLEAGQSPLQSCWAAPTRGSRSRRSSIRCPATSSSCASRATFSTTQNLGSIEFGVAVLKAQLVLVLGHTNCGAVGAAVAWAKMDLAARAHRLAGRGNRARGRGHARQPGDWLANAIVGERST